MQSIGGPSVRVLFDLAGAALEVSEVALAAGWERWLGPQRFTRRLQQLERAGLVARGPEVAGIERVVRLTLAGRLAALGGRDPEERWSRSWDGRWRLVVFDVPELTRTTRVRLERLLRRMSFGYLQDSVWLSPDPLDALSKAMAGKAGEAGTLTLFEGRPCGGESDADLVRGAWDFARIDRCYRDYLEVLGSRSARLGVRSRRDWIRAEWAAWCRAMRIDPLLPAAVLPPGYRGREAWQRRVEKMRDLFTRG